MNRRRWGGKGETAAERKKIDNSGRTKRADADRGMKKRIRDEMEEAWTETCIDASVRTSDNNAPSSACI